MLRQKVVLILHVTNQFFDDVFQRDHADDLPGPIANQRDMSVLPNQTFQGSGE